MYAEMFGGLHTDPAVHLQKTFTQKHDEMVLVKDIEFASCCEHHLLPFTGKAHIATCRTGKIVGLSKLARVVDAVARRPQVQERMTEEIADLIMTHLKARGVGVIVEASHSCMTIRGVRKPGAMTITSSMRGGFLRPPRDPGGIDVAGVWEVVIGYHSWVVSNRSSVRYTACKLRTLSASLELPQQLITDHDLLCSTPSNSPTTFAACSAGGCASTP